MKKRFFSSPLSWPGGFFAAALLLAMPPAHAARDMATMEGVERKLQTLQTQARPSVVVLEQSLKGGFSTGSGTIVSEDGIILTAAHVVDESKTVTVVFPDGKRTKAKVLGCDFDHDVAMVKILAAGPYPFVEIGDSSALKVGDDVVALGHAGGFDPKRPAPVRYGRIFKTVPGQVLRSDCILAGGDSGGPLFDLEGRLVGIHRSVGLDPAINNDVPINVAKSGWERLLKGERWGLDRESATEMSREELAGLDLKKFRHLMRQEAANNDGNLVTDPARLVKWLVSSGMNEKRATGMSPSAVRAFAQRCMKGMAAKDDLSVPDLPKEELAGLDLKKFRQRVMTEAAKRQGRIVAEPEAIATWLREAGMDAAKTKAMDATELVGWLSKAMGDTASVEAQEAGDEMGDKAPAVNPKDLEGVKGMDMEKFRTRLMAEALKNQGKLMLKRDELLGWMRESGLPAEKAKALSPAGLNAAVKAAMGYHGTVGPQRLTKEEKVIFERDKEVLTIISPGLAKIAPSVVTLMDGEKTLAMGTVIRSDGFILTKRSEIARAGEDRLRVRLADGRRLKAIQVRSFAEHDLALVKIAAKSLPAVKIPINGGGPELAPGSFVFTAGPDPDEPILGIGVVSVSERELRESGGFLGIAMRDTSRGVEIRETVAGGPSAKAGLLPWDRLVSLNGSSIQTSDEISRVLRSLNPGDKIAIGYQREKKTLTTQVVLGTRPGTKRAKNVKPVNAMGVEVSEVREDYPLVFQHDQQLKPSDCGSVVTDLHGNVVGVNVARAGRVDSYAIPVKTVAALLSSVDFETLAR